MAIEKEQLIQRQRNRNQTIGILIASTAAIVSLGVGTVINYWDELHGVEKIKAKTYQIYNDEDYPVVSIVVRKNQSTDLRRTHSSQEIAELKQVAIAIKANCPVVSEEPEFGPHRDFYFKSPQAARDCLYKLRKIHLPGE